jgi:hypothetical protein
VGAWKAVAALAVVIAGAVGAFAVYTFGWREDKASAPERPRVYVLRDGDIVLRPEAATRCMASQEGAFRNLFCARIGGGRHNVVFYEDSVLVWPYSPTPGGFPPDPFSYDWKP